MIRPVLELVAPFDGTVVALEELPDPVYSTGIIGSGLAVLPDPGVDRVQVLAPCTGLVHAVEPHAVMLLAENGRGVLVHVGRRTPDAGAPEPRVRVGDRVVPGDPLLVWTPPATRVPAHASPLVALQAARGSVVALASSGDEVRRGQALLLWS